MSETTLIPSTTVRQAFSPDELPVLEGCADAAYLVQAACVQEQLGTGVMVLAQRPKHCRQCAQNGGCGMGVLNRWLVRGDHRILVKTHLNLPQGSWIWLGFPKSDFMRVVFLFYCWPILLLLLGGYLGSACGPAGWPQDVNAGFGMIFGLAAGILMARVWANRGVVAARVVVLWPDQA